MNNIGAVGTDYTSYNKKAVDTAKKKDAKTEKVNVQEEKSAVYEKTQIQQKTPYSINKMGEEDRKALVEQMKKDQEARQQQLCDLVSQMFDKQSGVVKLAKLFTPENLKNVSAEDIKQAKEDVSEDGYWGVKQTSQRLFDFACALAGDDVEQMKKMQNAMEKGFKQATKAWGEELPGICKDTLDAANKLFEDYYKSKEAE